MKPTMPSAREEAAVARVMAAARAVAESVFAWDIGNPIEELKRAISALDKLDATSPSPPPTAARGEGEEGSTEAQERADEIARKYMDPNEGVEMSDGEWVMMFAALRDDLKSIAGALRERDERGGG